jgi:acyl-[acyl carrier protein]--UDP-N-acetylglucosamine O-acyltransferase
MSESAKQLVEEAQKAAQLGDHNNGMLYSRLADCIERLLAERAALAGHVESIDTALEAIRELTDAEP